TYPFARIAQRQAFAPEHRIDSLVGLFKLRTALGNGESESRVLWFGQTPDAALVDHAFDQRPRATLKGKEVSFLLNDPRSVFVMPNEGCWIITSGIPPGYGVDFFKECNKWVHATHTPRPVVPVNPNLAPLFKPVVDKGAEGSLFEG